MITEIQIENIKKYANGVTVYHDGKRYEYLAGSAPFNDICTVWENTFNGSRQMPALGVSLQQETLSALKYGVWLEFSFPKTYCSWDLPFEKLLIKLSTDLSCFDIIRYTSQYGYEGRCLHFNLMGNTLSNLYAQAIKNI